MAPALQFTSSALKRMLLQKQAACNLWSVGLFVNQPLLTTASVLTDLTELSGMAGYKRLSPAPFNPPSYDLGADRAFMVSQRMQFGPYAGIPATAEGWFAVDERGNLMAAGYFGLAIPVVLGIPLLFVFVTITVFDYSLKT